MVLSLNPSAVARPSGVRSIDLRTDMRVVADVIEEAFDGELDAGGRAALRDLRNLARLGPLLYLIVPASGELGSFFRGFVWLDEDEIVGNVTLQQADAYGQRTMIANVAVRKGYRGRGIARALMDAALTRIREIGSEWTLLQVRAGNDVALGLYERLGFKHVQTEHNLRSFKVMDAPNLPLLPGGELRPLYDTDWKAIEHLLHRAVPELSRWWHPRRNNSYRQGSDALLNRYLGQLMGRGHRTRLGLWLGNDLMGILDADTRPRREHHLDLLLHPDLRGGWERPLLAHGLRILQAYPHRPVVARLYDYQSHAVEALLDFGFRETSVLITMRKRMN